MKAKYSYILFTLVLGAISTMFCIQWVSSRKIGYVTTIKVFDEFKLKKELEAQYKKTQMVKQTYLDSLRWNIQSLTADENQKKLLDQEKLNAYKKAFLLKEDQFKREDENLFDQYNQQIWMQLNQYMQDYAKEKGLDYLLGASGEGSIMYAIESDDVTKDLIEYVNAKYSGK